MFFIVCIVLAAVNLLGFGLMGIDKRRAKRKKSRIPERVLLVVAVMGGIGALAGMLCFHHKTRKPLFWISVPLLSACQIALLCRWLIHCF